MELKDPGYGRTSGKVTPGAQSSRHWRCFPSLQLAHREWKQPTSPGFGQKTNPHNSPHPEAQTEALVLKEAGFVFLWHRPHLLRLL